MEATSRYLDAVRTRLNLPSDYALAARWNVTRQRISDYRCGRKTLGDDRCIEVAEILGIPPEQVLFEIQADRARKQGHDSIADIFDRVLKRLAHAPALLALLAVFLALASMPKEVSAMTPEFSGYANGFFVLRHNWHYVNLRRRILRGLFGPFVITEADYHTDDKSGPQHHARV